MGAVGTQEAVGVPNSSGGLFQQEQDRQSLLSSCWKRGGRGGNQNTMSVFSLLHLHVFSGWVFLL